ncbi:MAG: pilus assembly protein [Chloroflexi bacterium]|nr:pilus assembly protein [Chloroflexota bacterium]MBV9600659.1 pilus assembly protein [Chloroflexota bacterium]
MLSDRTRPCVAQALVEFALALPLVISLTLGALQLVLYAHARDVAVSAVQEAARLSAEDGRGLDDGYARARALVTAGLGSSLDPLAISGSMDAEVVRVRIDAGLRPIVPIGAPLPIQAEAYVARERFRPGGH